MYLHTSVFLVWKISACRGGDWVAWHLAWLWYILCMKKLIVYSVVLLTLGVGVFFLPATQ